MSQGKITGYRSVKFEILESGWIRATQTIDGVLADSIEFADTPRGRGFGRDYLDVAIDGIRPRRMPWADIRNGISNTYTIAERG